MIKLNYSRDILFLTLLIEELEYTNEVPEPNNDEMSLYALNLSPIDKYLHSLLHHSELWKLVDTNIVAMCDFADDEGN